MRKANMFITIGMIIFLLIHMVFGVLQMTGLGGMPMKWVSYTLTAFVVVHAIIGIILTVQSIIAMKKSNTFYFKENKGFWLNRISGLVIIIALIAHLAIFMNKPTDSTRLQAFNIFGLISQILLVLSIAIHVISNVKPALISFGITSLKRFSIDILLVLSVVLAISLIAFIIYYFRWQG